MSNNVKTKRRSPARLPGPKTEARKPVPKIPARCLPAWCETCFYSGGSAIKTCDFYLITGVRRGCQAGPECTRYLQRSEKKVDLWNGFPRMRERRADHDY